MTAKFYAWVMRIAKIGASILTVIGVWFAIAEYYDRKEAAKISRSLIFYENLNKNRVLIARENLSNIWIENSDSIEKKLEEEDVISWRSFVIDLIEANKAEIDVKILADYFDGVYACIYKELCDRETSVVLIKSFAQDFIVQNYSYILLIREEVGSENFAAGAEALALMSEIEQRESLLASLNFIDLN